MKKGFSLIEMLVVITVFAMIAGVSAQAIALSLSSARKTDAATDIRENVNYALSAMERNLRNAVSCTPAVNQPTITYVDQYRVTTTFSCPGIGSQTVSPVASGSANIALTGANIIMTACSFTCSGAPNTGIPQRVDISLSARTVGSVTNESSQVTVSSKVVLRSY